MRKSRLRIKGNDRFVMMVCRDIRRRWMQYGENRKEATQAEICEICKKRKATEYDHIEPVGSRPRIPHGLGEYAERMLYLKCQALCKQCHKKKTDRERKRRKK